MKRILLFTAIMLLAALQGFSQHNYKFNYQAVVRDGAGALVANGSTVGLRISILEGSASGTALYQETHSVVVNNTQGLVNLVIGDGTPTVGGIVFSGNFQDLSQEKYLKIEVDPAGGTAYTDMGATKLQFVPYAAHAFTASIAENGTQWENGSASAISYSDGNVNIGTNSPIGTSTFNVEQSVSSNHVMSVKQTGTVGSTWRGAIYGGNNATSGGGVGVIGEHLTNGWGVYGTAGGTIGIGVYGDGPVGVKAESIVTNGVAIELDGFIKVSGSKRTAFKTNPLVSPASNISLIYGGASNSDIVLVTPISTSSTMPSWALIWSGTSWVLWNASDDAIPSNFPAGTAFNVLVIKQ